MPSYSRLDSQGIEAARARLAQLSSSPEDRVRALVLRTAMWFAGAADGALPSPEEVIELAGLRDDESLERLSWVCGRGALDRVLAFDAEGVEAWARALSFCAPSSPHRLRIVRGWLRTMAGGAPDVGAAMKDAASQARAAGDAAAMVEANVVQVMNALSLGDLDGAERGARQASRMARTDSVPQSEYLANLTLARVRRARGATHLALHILRTLATVVSPPWRAWIRLELQLSGASEAAGSDADIASLVARARRAALDDDAPAFESAADAATSLAAGFHTVRSELQSAFAALDARRTAPADTDMQRWIDGATDVVPSGLHVLGARHDTVGLVVRSPGARGRRILAAGLGSKGLDANARPRHRTDLALAHLLLHPDGAMQEAEFFRQIYGFEFESDRHHTVLDALIHRMRESLGEHATLERAGGRLTLAVERTFCVRDPRCSDPLEDRVLRTLASEGTSAARSVAAKLDVPLRTVQLAIRDVVDAGMCLSTREGRVVKYYIEDTTFSEPTQSGVLLPTVL